MSIHDFHPRRVISLRDLICRDQRVPRFAGVPDEAPAVCRSVSLVGDDGGMGENTRDVPAGLDPVAEPVWMTPRLE